MDLENAKCEKCGSRDLQITGKLIKGPKIDVVDVYGKTVAEKNVLYGDKMWVVIICKECGFIKEVFVDVK